MSIRILVPIGVLALTLCCESVQAQSPGTPLSSSAASTQLQGKTGSIRSSAIAQVAPYLKASLTGQETADILGTASELSEAARANAILSIARAKKLGPLGAEAALMLKGATGNNRSMAIAEIAPYLKIGLTGQETADILGTASELSEAPRANAILSIARAGKTMPGLTEGELAPVLAGMTGSNRALALSELRVSAASVAAGKAQTGSTTASPASAPVATQPTQTATLGPGLTAISPPSVSGSKTAQIFSLKGSNLQLGVRVMVYATNFQKTLDASQVRWVSTSEVQMTIVTDTFADNWSVEVSNPDGRRSARVAFRVNAPTTVAVATPPGATPPSPTTTGGALAASSPVPALAAASQPLSAQQAAQINAMINAKLKRLLSEPSEQPPEYFFSTDNWLDLVNAAFRGNSQLREQYDGYYFGGLVYRQLAVQRLVGARQFVRASKGAAAQHAIAESDRNRQMMRTSWAAAIAAAVDSVGNAAEIQRLASTIYSASKIVVLCGSSAASPAAAAAFERVYAVTDFGIDWADVGFSEAARGAVVDKSTTWLIEKAGITNNCAQLLATDLLFLDLPRRLETIVRSEEFKRALGDSIAASLASVQRGDPIPIAQLIIRGLTGGTTVALPKVGTRDMQLITLGYPFSRLIEVIDSANAGFTQTVSGRRGEEAWTVLGDPAPMSIAAGKSWGLRAAVFENKTSNQCAIVFGGTELTDLKDWANNFAQWQGSVPPEYSQGADFAAQAIAHCVGRKIVIAGHSLGGGIAQYAYLKTGSRHLTYTFNPAGLSMSKRLFEADFSLTFRGPSENVVAFIARAYDPSSGTEVGRDVVSMIPGTYTLGVQVPVPVYSWSPTPHFISVLAEGLVEQRKRCLASTTCR